MDEAKKPVTRANVFELCDTSLNSGITPRLKDFKCFFTAPSSPKLAVYFAEWKEANEDKLSHSVDYWKARADERALEIERLNSEIASLKEQLNTAESHLNLQSV